VGDSITFGVYPSNPYYSNYVDPTKKYRFAILKVDQIEIGTANVRRFLIDSGGFNDTLIGKPGLNVYPNYFFDGIGSSGGGIFPAFATRIELGQALQCYSDTSANFSYDYSSAKFTSVNYSCPLVTGLVDSPQESALLLIKRLSETEIEIDYSQEPFIATVYDVQGKQVLQQSSSQGSILSFENLPSGIYLLKVSLPNSTVKTTKVVR
jgi:hypothetical protein